MQRKNTLELIGQEGIILKDEIVSGILRLDTKSDLKNAKDIRGLDTLSVTAKNIENEGNLLSDKNLYVKAEGKLLNKGTGLIKGKENTYLEGSIIENNRGKILSEGSLTLIAETLIRNDNGKIDAKGDIYGEVKNGHFENVGTTEVEIKDVLKATGTEGAAVGGIFSRLRRKPRPQTVKQEKERTYRIDMDDSNITSEGSIYIKAENGDVINKDGGNIEGKKGVRIDAKNVYNTERYIEDEKNKVILAGGGRIKGENVYLKVTGKVVNGTEEYTKGTYRREDGVSVDNRQVNINVNPSSITGTSGVLIEAGELVNTSKITGNGTLVANVTEKATNASIGNVIGKMEGNMVLIEGTQGVTNIGGEIRGGEATQVTSKEGKVLNESTITSQTIMSQPQSR